jgi:hypothetical protein
MASNTDNSLVGQWLGTTRGDPNADIVIDLDDIGERVSGIASLFPHDHSLFSSCASVSANKYDEVVNIKAVPLHFDSFRGVLLDERLAAIRYQGVVMPKWVEARLTLKNENTLEGTWSTDIETYGTVTLNRSRCAEKSSVAKIEGVSNWRDFKAYISDKNPIGQLYRGQAKPYPLRTSFHRTSRNDITRFLHEDVPTLHRSMANQLSRIFDLEKPIELGAFLNLVQHHGFPTPLLDWTYSPYVAAFFAFAKAMEDAVEPVKIFCFDADRYRKEKSQFQTLTLAPPHLSILDAYAIDNARAIPQQGALTLTNIENIEAWLEFIQIGDEPYLKSFELPPSERQSVLADLNLMGIKKSTLFPGLDSICEEIRERRF